MRDSEITRKTAMKIAKAEPENYKVVSELRHVYEPYGKERFDLRKISFKWTFYRRDDYGVWKEICSNLSKGLDDRIINYHSQDYYTVKYHTYPANTVEIYESSSYNYRLRGF